MTSSPHPSHSPSHTRARVRIASPCLLICPPLACLLGMTAGGTPRTPRGICVWAMQGDSDSDAPRACAARRPPPLRIAGHGTPAHDHVAPATRDHVTPATRDHVTPAKFWSSRRRSRLSDSEPVAAAAPGPSPGPPPDCQSRDPSLAARPIRLSTRPPLRSARRPHT
jgi:hypothetical protein